MSEKKMTKEQIVEYFCKRLGRKPSTPEWKMDYDRFMGWDLDKLEEQYKYIMRIHT
jgi:uncharacterized Fe-S cluster-containing radical SAM superfamily enzyme